VKTVNGVPVYVKDVAHVRMGSMVQTMSSAGWPARHLDDILKGEGASTLSVVNACGPRWPTFRRSFAPELKMELLFDQSVFVRSAVEGVLKEERLPLD